MVTILDARPELLIQEIAKDLKEHRKVQQPAFALFVKSGAHKERAPQNPEWWYIRCASILRRIYVDGAQGTESLRTYYGGRKARGVKPHRFKKSSGKVIRTCFQELEKQGFLKHEKNKKGRFITGAGEKYLLEKAKKVFAEQDKILQQISEKKKQKEMEKRKKTTKEGPKQEAKVKKAKKRKKKEPEDPTAIKLKKKQ